jgi:hypothetical protein
LIVEQLFVVCKDGVFITLNSHFSAKGTEENQKTVKNKNTTSTTQKSNSGRKIKIYLD